MKNKLLRNVLICVCAILLLVALIYFALVYYYRQGFMANTWVNGVYCTGKSLEEVNKELLQQAEAPFLTIIDIDGTSYEIAAEDMGMMLDFSDGLKHIFGQQQAYEWPIDLIKGRSEELVPEITYDPEKLYQMIGQLPFVQKQLLEPKKLEILLTEEGYVLQDTLNNRLNEHKLYDYLGQKMEEESFLQAGVCSGNLVIDLKEAFCYEDVQPDATQTKTLKQWEILKPYVNCGIVYDMGDEKISLAGKIASSFLSTDQHGNVLFERNGQPIIDTAAIEAFINSLADAYNTYGKELTFTSTAGEKKTVPYVTYGTELDVENEIAYLTEAFTEQIREIHTPEYTREAYVRGKNDIGNTYIEVDMGHQKLYAYLDGQIIVETEIVTGNMKRKMSTPEGVVYVYQKQRNRTLRGPGYASFVKYWMPIKGGIGLHDASWRKKFGGEIYKTNGSHGCINIPRDVMDEIYDNFEIGVPVILFY